MAYLLSIPGALIALLLRRDDPFIVYHARQSLAIHLAILAVPLMWLVIAWITAWIPLAGVIVGLTLFALVIAAEIGLAISWLFGIINAVRGIAKPVPLVGGWALRRKPKAETDNNTEEEIVGELLERTHIPDA